MARKPAHLEMAGGRGPRQRIWEALRARRTAMSISDISRASKVELDPVRTYMRSLARGGYLEAAGAAAGEEKRWDLVRDVGAFAPRVKEDGTPVTQGLVNENMWRTMRIMKDGFTAADLVIHGSTAVTKIAEATAKSYIKSLAAAGYLRVLEEGHAFIRGKGAKQARYCLPPTKYTGPRPPMIQRTKCIYDPNLAKVVWQEEPDHDAC